MDWLSAAAGVVVMVVDSTADTVQLREAAAKTRPEA
jgi:hypothetical protein